MARQVLQITIPTPQPTADLYRGYKLEPEERLHTTAVRLLNRERAEVQAAAQALGISYSEFVRWTIVYAARELKKELELAEFS